MPEKVPPSEPKAESQRKSEREQFYLCPVCGEQVDWRDPEQVMWHAGHIDPDRAPH